MIETVSETGSTNADLADRLAQGQLVPEGHWLVADRQSAGRGRQGRSWLDAPGNFMGSTIVRLQERDPSPASLSFVAALAVYETAANIAPMPQSLMLKWPNDVLLDGAKFCGLLLELAQGHAIIGIGVNLASAPKVEDRRVKSLAEKAPPPARDTFAEALAEQFAIELQRWREYGTEPIFNRWRAAAHKEGTPLSVHGESGDSVMGAYAGLAPDGALLLRLPDGSTTAIHAGDVMLEGN